MTTLDTESVQEFYASLGRCIAGWALLDGTTFHAFCKVTRLLEEPAALLYTEKTGVKHRIDRLLSLVKLESSEGEYKNLQEAVSGYVKLSTDRNLIAHGSVQLRKTIAVSYDGKPKKFEYELIAAAPLHETVFRAKVPRSLSLPQLEEHWREVGQIVHNLRGWASTYEGLA